MGGWLGRFKWGFLPTQHKGRDANMPLLDRFTIDGSGQSQPPATTLYAAGTLPSCGRRHIVWNYWN